jgi:hypothetical protein
MLFEDDAASKTARLDLLPVRCSLPARRVQYPAPECDLEPGAGKREGLFGGCQRLVRRDWIIEI